MVGTTCARIEAIMADWLDELANEFRVVGITGDHQENRWGSHGQHGRRQWMSPQGADWNEYDDRLQARSYDLALVNGNHYPAERQIVFLDDKKAGTLERRREQLTDVIAIVKVAPQSQYPAWLTTHLDATQQEVPVYEADQLDGVLKLVKSTARRRTIPLQALVLAGGKSSRMGQDKSELVYRNGQTELERMTRMCQELGLKVFHSVRESDPEAEISQIADRFLGLGPLGAIASAFLFDPETAWLVVACDLPLLEKSDLEELIKARDTRRYATAIQGADKPFPEPLIAIYEPRVYERMLRFLALGYACPRKVLINSDIATSLVKNERPLTNANTPEDRQRILEMLQNA